MAREDVSVSYGGGRRADPLSDGDQARLRELAGKHRRTPAEGYELGALKARARTSQQGRRVLDDLGHEQAAVRQQRQQQQPDRQRDRVTDSEYHRNWVALGKILRDGE
jgi:hypothetical protein